MATDLILQELRCAAWAVHPDVLPSVQALMIEAAGGPKAPDQARPEARSRATTVKPASGIAVVDIRGLIVQRREVAYWFGGTSTDELQEVVTSLLADDSISHVVFRVDSPGGTVAGVIECAEQISRAVKGSGKTVIAIADSMMCSAAYWLGSTAPTLYATQGAIVGSIGVILVHWDYSKMLEGAGLHPTVIRSPEHKDAASPYKPLSDEDRAHLQGEIDEFYADFVKAVAKHRGVKEAVVRKGYGQGRGLTARAALEEGMIDGIMSMSDLLAKLGVRPGSARRAAEGPALEPAAAALFADLISTGSVPQIPAAGTPLPVAPESAVRGVADVVDEDDQDEDEDEDERAEEDETTAQAKPPEPAAEEQSRTDDGGRDRASDTPPTPTAVAARGAAEMETTIAAAVGEDRAAERKRQLDIVALCKAHSMQADAAEFIAEGKSVADVQATILDRLSQTKAMVADRGIDFTADESKKYSLARAILSAAENGGVPKGFEGEVHSELSRNLPAGHKVRGGFFVPTRGVGQGAARMGFDVGHLRSQVMAAGLPSGTAHRLFSLMGEMERMATLNEVGSPTAGGNLVFTEAGEFIDLLRNRMKVAELGATILTGLQGDLAFPKQTAANNFQWVGENPNTPTADSSLTVGQVPLTPHTGQSTTGYTRQLLAQGVVDIDQLIRVDLSTITALGIDRASIAGTGMNNQPRGILNTNGIGDVEIGTDGGVPTYDTIVDLETAIADANADIGTMAYLTTAGMRGQLKKTASLGNTANIPVWNGAEMNGYPSHVSNQVPRDLEKGTSNDCHAIIHGVWNQLIVGYWGAYELVVDPYTQKKNGIIELTSFQLAGLCLRHVEAFAACQDARVTAASS